MLLFSLCVCGVGVGWVRKENMHFYNSIFSLPAVNQAFRGFPQPITKPFFVVSVHSLDIARFYS